MVYLLRILHAGKGVVFDHVFGVVHDQHAVAAELLGIIGKRLDASRGQIDHDQVVVLRQKRHHAVKEGILEHKQRLSLLIGVLFDGQNAVRSVKERGILVLFCKIIIRLLLSDRLNFHLRRKGANLH